MYPMILGAAGYTLLLSSFITLIVLLKKGFKQHARTPLHVLSISDMLTSVLTAVILLINQYKMTNTSIMYNDENINYSKIDNKSEYHKAFAQFYRKYNNSYQEENDFNATSTNCNFSDVSMQYAIFLVPFANAFVSLLSFSTQCSINAACMNKICTRLIMLRQNITQEHKGINDNFVNPVNKRTIVKHKTSAGENDLEYTSDCENFVPKKKIWNRVLNIFKNTEQNKPGNNNKIVGLNVLSQWLAPIFLTVILYFLEHQDIRTMHQSSDMKCIFMMNFPFENVHVSSNVTSEQFSFLNEDIIPVVNDYIESKDTVRISNPNSKEAEDIVSKIYKIVQSALNETNENFNQTVVATYYNASDLWSITKYANKDDSMYDSTKDKNNIMYDEIDFTEQSLINENHNVLNPFPGTWTQGESTIKDKDKHEVELKLFEDLMKGVSKETNTESSSIKNNTYSMQKNNAQNSEEINVLVTNEYSSTTVKNSIENIENLKQDYINFMVTAKPIFQYTMKNDTSKSKSEIYADIVERIQNITMQYKVKEKYENSLSNGKKQNTQEKLNVYSLQKRPVMEDSIFSFKNGSIVRRAKSKNISNVETQSESTVYIKNHCFLPPRLLRLHLLITLFIIYFVPILISCILYIRAKFTCQYALEKLKTKDAIHEKISIDDLDNNAERNERTGWFSQERRNSKLGECSNSDKCSAKLENYNCKEDICTIDSLASSNDETRPDENETFTNILKEAEKAKMLFKLLKRSLLFGVLLWTPMFLEILVKVFLCTNTPSWLTNGSFLSGISFGIIRNIFNLGMINSQGIAGTTDKKQNSIHPRT